eukprot:232171_1
MLKEIAIRFACRNGMIIQLDNSSKSAAYTRVFDCSFISYYTEEDEMLFFGSTNPIRVAGIILMKTKENFIDVFGALYYFECMITGCTDINEMKIRDTDFMIIIHLVTYSVSFQKWKNKKWKN